MMKALTLSAPAIWILVAAGAMAGVGQHVEDFSTTSYMDPSGTTALWDVGLGRLTVWPFAMELAGSCPTSWYAATAVAVAGDRAFVGTDHGWLYVVDISAPTLPVTIDSVGTGDPIHGVTVEGNHAFLATVTMPPKRAGGGLYVVDITHPGSLGSVSPLPGVGDSTFAVAISGDRAYVAAGPEGVVVVDIEDPMDPVLAGSCPTGGEARGLALAGTWLLVADGAAGLTVLDLENPDQPKLRTSRGHATAAVAITVSGDRAYLACGGGGLWVANVQDPLAPTDVASLSLPGSDVRDLALDGDYLYLADEAPGGDGLIAVDVSVPSEPRWLSSLPGIRVADLAVTGRQAFLAGREGGFLVADMAEAVLPPLPIARIEVPGAPGRLALAGEHLYVADGEGGCLQVVDVTDPTSPALVDPAGIDTPGQARDVAVAGDHLYVADGRPFLSVLDLSDPAHPTTGGIVRSEGGEAEYADVVVSGGRVLVTATSQNSPDFDGFLEVDVTDPLVPVIAGDPRRYYLGGWRHSRGIAVVGDSAYVAHGLDGLVVVRLSDNVRASYPISGGEPQAVAVAGSYAYVAAGGAGLQIVDVSRAPDDTSIVGAFDTAGFSRDIALAGSLAFVADDDGGLYVLDVSDPAAPDSLARYLTTGPVRAVAIDGSHAYLACHNQGLHVLDVGTPDAPARIGVHKQSYWSSYGCAYTGVTVQDGLAYVADELSGLRIVDVSDPAHPDSGWACCTAGRAAAVAVVDGYAYVADGTNGLQVVDVGDHRNPRLVNAFAGQGTSYCVEVSGNRTFLTTVGPMWSPEGLIISDVTDPVRPALAGWNRAIPQGTSAYYTSMSGDMAVAGDRVYYTSAWGSGGTVDITDPADPFLDGALPYSFQSMDLEVRGDLAYVASNWYGLQIIDVEDPAVPARVGWVAGEVSRPMGLDVKGDLAFVASDQFGFLIYDVSGAEPVEVARGEEDFNSHGVVVAGDYAYVSDYASRLRVYQVFSRECAIDSANVAQSLPVDGSDSTIVRVGLAADCSERIDWQVSADAAGSSWTDVVAGGTAVALDEPGPDLRWRATMSQAGPDELPGCDQLALEWWFDCPLITGVEDIPDDQGGWTRLGFLRSGHDFADDASPVQSYYVWRRVDSPGFKRLIAAQGTPLTIEQKRGLAAAMGFELPEMIPPLRLVGLGERVFLTGTVKANALFPDSWELVASVPGLQEESYTVAVPTSGYPELDILLEFTGGANRIDPTPYSPFTAMVYLTNFPAGGGLMGTEFQIARSFGGGMMTYTNLLPLGFDIGDPESGWALATTECVLPDEEGRVAVGSIQYYYDGGTSGTLTLSGFPGSPDRRTVQDCDLRPGAWCVQAEPSGNAGVWADPPAGECSPTRVWAVYRVSAHRADPTLWYVSPPDSGYSTDQVPPAAVKGLRIPARLQLAWEAGDEPDIDHYTVYATREESGLGAAWQVSRTRQTTCTLPDTTVGRFLFVTATDLSGNESDASELLWNQGTAVPDRAFLAQNFPNPFNPMTTVRFGLPRKTRLRVTVYDVTGRAVRLLAEGDYPPGEHEIPWDGRDASGRAVAAGVYLCRLTSTEFEGRVKMVLLR